MKRNLFLNISQVASFIGKNPYDYITSFETLWKRYDYDNYSKIISDLNDKLENTQLKLNDIENEKKQLYDDLKIEKITNNEYEASIKKIKRMGTDTIEIIRGISEKVDDINLTKMEQVEKILGKDVISNIKDVNMDTEVKKNITNKLIKENNILSIIQKKRILETTESVINTTHGTLNEDSAIMQFEKRFDVKLDISQMYYKKSIGESSESNIYIGGKVDGLYIDSIKEKSYIVEVKNRMRGFFNNVREYENIQIQLYMHMLNMNNAKLVEKYKEKIRITIIPRDEETIKNIIEYLEIFVKNFEIFLKNQEIKKEYVNKSAKDKKIFLDKLYLTEISDLEHNKIDIKCLIDDLDDDLL